MSDNNILTNDIIASEAVMQLDNHLVMSKKVHRGYEKDFKTMVNGKKVGDEITISKPIDYEVREGEIANYQKSQQGSLTLTVDKVVGVDMEFTEMDRTLHITKFAEQFIKPAMIQLANKIDLYCHEEYKNLPSWIGTPGNVVNTFSKLAQAPKRMDELANPKEGRFAVLSPTDHWGLLGSQTNMFISDAAKGAYRNGNLGNIAGLDIAATQNTVEHIVGDYAGTPLIKGANQKVTYETVMKNNWKQTVATDGWANNKVGLLKHGDIITIAGVYAVNPVTKARLPFLREFVVLQDADSSGAGAADLVISPPIIDSGAYQTVSSAPADNAPITVKGDANTGYTQNIIGHRNAIAMVTVPMEKPEGAVSCSRRSYKNTNVRLIPGYDHTTNKSFWRLDVLLGKATVDPRLAHRLSG